MKETKATTEKWVIGSKEKFSVGISSNRLYSSQCDRLLDKSVFNSLSEAALHFAIPEGRFKVIAYDHDLDALGAMVILQMRQNGLAISSPTKHRLSMMGVDSIDESIKEASDTILNPSLDFQRKFMAAKIWIKSGHIPDKLCQRPNRKVEIFKGLLEKMPGYPSESPFVSSR